MYLLLFPPEWEYDYNMYYYYDMPVRIRRHFWWQSSVVLVVFPSSELVVSTSTRVSVLYTLHFSLPVVYQWSWYWGRVIALFFLT